MTIRDENQRFVMIIEKKIFEQFKILAQEEKRSASNFAAKILTDYVEKNKAL
ncbi:MAG: hypothetical protein WCG95_04065 [bacterium]